MICTTLPATISPHIADIVALVRHVSIKFVLERLLACLLPCVRVREIPHMRVEHAALACDLHGVSVSLVFSRAALRGSFCEALQPPESPCGGERCSAASNARWGKPAQSPACDEL